MGAAHYEIVVKGRLGSTLSGWFDQLEVRAAGPDTTVLEGWFIDQAALQGVLAQLGEFGVELSSVRRVPDTA